MDSCGAAPPAKGPLSALPARFQPIRWSIAVRSAVASSIVVLVAVLITAAALVLLLYQSLLASVDDAAAGRLRDIVAGLEFDSAAELDDTLLATDQRVFAVQVIDAGGTVVRRSSSAPSMPLLPPAEFGPTVRTGFPDDLSPNDDMRMAGQTATTPTGTYTVIVGAGSEAAEHTAAMVALLLSVAAPIIALVAGVVSHHLVKRSLRSVEAIRARVSAISASDLAERVPVPPQQDEISALATTMNEMLARVEAGHAAQRRFVGDASHELRSPLASIISALEVAQDYPETVDDELRSGTLLPEVLRMQELVDDLLLLARADERGIKLREELIHVDDLVENEAIRLRRADGVEISLQTEPATISGDVNGISRVLRNVVDNAARHATTAIRLAVHRRDDEVEIVVADDGAGIPAQDRARVFGRFVRLDDDRSREGGGSGLGLAIVAEIVAAHRGRVAIDEPPGGGTRVRITLPRETRGGA